MQRMLSRILGVALILAGLLLTEVARAQVTGQIEGNVTDEATGRPLAGVTVTVTGPQGEQTEFTDAAGHYIITELPPGEYTVRFYFSNIKLERAGVFLNVDKTLRVNAAMPTQRAEVKTYRVTEKAPTVDVGNTQVQTQVTSELVRNTAIPGVNGRRTYESVLTLAPGAAAVPADPGGFSFNGAAGPENNYLIDGLNTTNPAFGLIGTQLTLEFIGETELITGGYNAEYGRSTGAVVNAITKSGTNTFHGGAWFYYTPFQLDPERLARLGESVSSSTKIKNAFDFGFDLGGPILKDRIFFYVGFAPTFTTFTADRVLRTRTMNNLPAGQMTGSYLGDVDNNQKCPSYLASSALCTQGGFITQDLPGQYTKHYDTNQNLYNWIAKLNFQFNQNNSLSVQYIGSPNTLDGVSRFVGNNVAATNFNGGDGFLLLSQTIQVHDTIGHFVSKLLDRRLQIDVIGGFHYEGRTQTPKSGMSASGPYNGSDPGVQDRRTNQPLWRYEQNVAPCTPQDGQAGRPTVHGVSWNPCPVSGYFYGGYGLTRDTTNLRGVAALSATLFARLAGTHAFKLGGDFEYVSLRSGRFYSPKGGAASGRWRINPGDAVNRTQFGTLAADGTVQLLPNGFNPTTVTLNESVFVRDSWNVGFVPGLTINAGVRWEFEQVKGANNQVVLNINDNIAPRVGFIYDFTRKGQSKIFASYGRFYESIPLDINDRQFSGEGLAVQTVRPAPAATAAQWSTCQRDANGKFDVSTCMLNNPSRAQLNGGVYGVVAPNIKGQYSNEVVAGLQYDVGWDMVLGASYIHRDIGRIIEDMSPDGGQDYIIANPSEAVDSGAVKSLQDKIARETDPMKKADLQSQLSLYQAVPLFPKPVRDYNALVLTATKRLSHNFIVLASYTYSRDTGNYPGLFSYNNGQLDPNISSQYDLPELMINRNGPLPNDRPHNLKILGTYMLPITDNDHLAFGLNFNLLSGRPINVLGGHSVYGPNEVFLLPAGAGGRTPLVTSFDLHLGYGRQISKVMRLDVYWDIFNLFNQHEVLDTDDQYAVDLATLPIKNGTIKDLATLKTTSGTPVTLNPNYGRPVAYQAPLSMRFGIRASF